MSDKLVTVAEYESTIEAELAKDALEDKGIRAVVVGENLDSVMTQIEYTVTIEVKVMESDAEKARSIIENVESKSDESQSSEEES